MTDVQISPTAQKVLQIMQQNRGTAYAPTDMCEVADCTTGQAQIALEALARAGLVQRQESVSGTATYVATK